MLHLKIECAEKSLHFHPECRDNQYNFFGVEKGEPGLSPSASVERIDGGAKITITDNSGTTEAIVYDGRDPGEEIAWSEITGKPFERIGYTLAVTDGTLDVNIHEVHNDAGGITTIIG